MKFLFTCLRFFCNVFSTSHLIDVAISSPFGGKDEQGLVFIYNGYAKGLREKPSQVIPGQWSSATSFAPPGFGYTMKGGKDLDHNGYPGESWINHCFTCFMVMQILIVQIVSRILSFPIFF